MKYLMLLWESEAARAARPDSERGGRVMAYLSFLEAMREAKVLEAGAPLQPAHTASSVTVRDGKVVSAQGPGGGAQQQLTACYLIDVPNLEHALAWAARCPVAEVGTVELRPVMDFPRR